MTSITGRDDEYTELSYRERISNRLLIDSYMDIDELAQRMAESIAYQLRVALRSRRDELLRQRGALQ